VTHLLSAAFQVQPNELVLQMPSLPCTAHLSSSGRGPSWQPLLLAASYQQLGSATHSAESRIARHRTFSAFPRVPSKAVAMSTSEKAQIINRIGTSLFLPQTRVEQTYDVSSSARRG
jgi:hypothetical protein